MPISRTKMTSSSHAAMFVCSVLCDDFDGGEDGEDGWPSQTHTSDFHDKWQRVAMCFSTFV